MLPAWNVGRANPFRKNDRFSPNRICLHTQKPAQTNTHRIAAPHRSFYSQMLLHLPFSQNNLDAYLFRRRYLHAAFTDRSFYARYLSHALLRAKGSPAVLPPQGRRKNTVDLSHAVLFWQSAHPQPACI